jgi:hypothetical protein
VAAEKAERKPVYDSFFGSGRVGSVSAFGPVAVVDTNFLVMPRTKT